MSEEDKISLEKASFGGDVADFLGTLKQIDSGETYKNSMNPYGNPFEGKSPKEMVKTFSSRQGQENLDILAKRLDEFYGMKKSHISKEVPKPYSEARQAIASVLEHKTR